MHREQNVFYIAKGSVKEAAIVSSQEKPAIYPLKRGEASWWGEDKLIHKVISIDRVRKNVVIVIHINHNIQSVLEEWTVVSAYQQSG